MITLEKLSEKTLDLCNKKGWKRDWQAGVYLHLEASEFIEALRGKHGCPIEEAGDTLFVLLSICAANGIKIDEVVDRLNRKVDILCIDNAN